MSRKRIFMSKQKVRLLREHLDNGVYVSELCELYQITQIISTNENETF